MPPSQSRIAELAAAVSHHTQMVDKYLVEKGLPQPSFHADGPVDLQLPPEIEKSRNAALQASQELNDLLQKPTDLILWSHDPTGLVYLKLISQFNLANKAPVDGETTFGDLAADLGIEEGAITRILRYGISYRVFREPRPGVLVHSAASRQIAEDTRVADFVGTCVDEMWPAATKIVDALMKWPQAAEPNQSGFSLAHNTDQSFYTVLSQSPDRARRFGGAMSFIGTGDTHALRHLTDGYPWETISSGTVVDIGGSHGDAAFALAQKHADLHLIVQDLPEVVANCEIKEGLRVEFLAHDFFEDQPVKGAEVYLYRCILHNWPDKYCIRILRALIPALKKGARVLVMDMAMPPPGTVPNELNRKLRSVDLIMLLIGNAKERDHQEWRMLFEQADARFVFKGVTQPPGSALAFIETVWEG